MQVFLLPEDEELPTPPGHLALLLPQTSSSVYSEAFRVLALQSQKLTVPLTSELGARSLTFLRFDFLICKMGLCYLILRVVIRIK